jgi:5'-nucleotidase
MIVFWIAFLFALVVYIIASAVNDHEAPKTKPKRKPILLIDMDGVIADYYGQFVRIWRMRHPGRMIVPAENLKGMYLEDSYPAQYENDIRRVNCSVGFFEGMLPIKGAIAALNRILDEGEFDVFLCSTPDTGSFNHSCPSEKVRWVELLLGKRWLKRIILTHDKTMVVGDFLIDDKPDIKGIFNPAWKQIVFTHAYNKHLTDHPRLDDWSEWETLKHNLLAEFNQTN